MAPASISGTNQFRYEPGGVIEFYDRNAAAARESFAPASAWTGLRRRVVERTFGRLMHHSRLARDYEAHPHRSEVVIDIAMVDLMNRRPTRESAHNWRDS